MLTKNILIGALIFLFFFGLSGAVNVGDVEKLYASTSGLIIPMNMENNNIEFEYLPIEISNFASIPIMKADSDVIDFDYSPRDDAQSTVVVPPVNTDSGDIQFDYSPKSMNCETPYC